MQSELMKFDPVTGKEKPYPSNAEQYRKYHGKVAWLYNPYTGEKRTALDIGSDTFGLAICDGVGYLLSGDISFESLDKIIDEVENLEFFIMSIEIINKYKRFLIDHGLLQAYFYKGKYEVSGRYGDTLGYRGVPIYTLNCKPICVN